MLLTSSVISLIIHLMQTSSDFEQDITYWRCDWPVAGPSEITWAWWWWTLQTHTLKWIFIYVVHQNIFILSMQFDAFNGHFVVNIKWW